MLYILLLLISCSEIDGSSSVKNKKDLFVKAKEENWDRVLNSSIFSINSINEEDGNTLLHYAAMQNNVEAIENLLKKGAENKYNNDGNLPIHVAAIEGSDESLVKFLENNSIESSNKAGDRLIHLAINDNNLSAVNLLKSKNVNLYSLDSEGNLPIHLAIINNNLDIVKVLIEDYVYSEGEIDILIYRNKNKGYNSLHLAANLKTPLILGLLFSKFNVNVGEEDEDRNTFINNLFLKDENGRDFIQIAISNNFVDEIDMFLSLDFAFNYGLHSRAINNSVDNNGNNIFHHAAMSSNLFTIVNYLKQFSNYDGVEENDINNLLNTKNNDGRTPRELAAYLGRSQTIVQALNDLE